VRSLVRVGGTLGAGGAMVALAFVLDEGALPMYTRMGLAAIVAVGLSLLMGFGGQVSLGQGAFYAIGAYTAGILSVGIAVNGFAAAAVGGLVSIRYAYIGGLLLGIAEQMVVTYGDRLTDQARQYELAAALIIILFVIGWRSRHEVEAT
jgi:ABC-type branched-subunit amino acid transport system permease subunit